MPQVSGGEKQSSDVIIVGGGAIGSAVAYGVARLGHSVIVLDGADTSHRAARGNAGLVWFQRKGLGMQPYVELCREATELWPEFSGELEQETNLQLSYQKTGGIELCHCEDDVFELKSELETFRDQSPVGNYDVEFIGRNQVQSMLPDLKLGENVLGASYSEHDGQVYPLAMLRALQTAFQAKRGTYLPDHPVSNIRRHSGSYIVETPQGNFTSDKLVLAAGLGIPELTSMLGERISVKPQRGQLIVTESLESVIPYAMSGVRQTPAGNLLLGATNEWVGYEDAVTTEAVQSVAAKWIRSLPDLNDVGIIRTWGALRSLTEDGNPIYHEFENHPGVFVLTSHSAITLASVHADRLAKWVVSSEQPDDFKAFNPHRFDSSQKDA